MTTVSLWLLLYTQFTAVTSYLFLSNSSVLVCFRLSSYTTENWKHFSTCVPFHIMSMHHRLWVPTFTLGLASSKSKLLVIVVTVLLQAECPCCRPINSFKALKNESVLLSTTMKTHYIQPVAEDVLFVHTQNKHLTDRLPYYFTSF